MFNYINNQSIQHRSNNGTVFNCSRADLRAPIEYYFQWSISVSQQMQDVAEFAAWHRGCIWDQLNGFQGYDTLDFVLVENPNE